MNELEQIKAQITNINNQRVKYQTLIDQAKKQCEEIQAKYNITTLEELQALVNQADQQYQQSIQQANAYIQEANQVLAGFNGLC